MPDLHRRSRLCSRPSDLGTRLLRTRRRTVLPASKALPRSATPRRARPPCSPKLGKVLTHPRCMNCHPAGDRPRQGDIRRLHQPPVERGDDGFGLPAHALSDLSSSERISTPAMCRAIRSGISRRARWAGKARRSGRSARRSRIPRATAAGRSKRSCIMSGPIIWSAGLGLPAPAANPLQARKARLARFSTPG